MAGALSADQQLSLRDRHKLRNRNAILAAAVLLIDRDGVDNTSMKDIAAVAEVSDTTVFNYFKSKDDLITALIEELNGPRSLPALLDTRPETESPFRALRNLLRSVPSDETEARAKSALHARARADRQLWGAYLRWNYDTAEELTGAFRRRAPRWSHRTARAAAHAAVGALEAVIASQPKNATTKAWLADIDDVLARLEKAWPR